MASTCLRYASGDRQKCLVAACLLVPYSTLDFTKISQSDFESQTTPHCPQWGCQWTTHWGSFQMFTWRLMWGLCLTHTPSWPVPCSKPGLRTSSQGNLPHFFPRPLCLLQATCAWPTDHTWTAMARRQHQGWCQRSDVYTNTYIYYLYLQLMLCSRMTEGECKASVFFKVCFKLSTSMACCFVNAGDRL